jgi:isoleucyl-tRNA synthetase
LIAVDDGGMFTADAGKFSGLFVLSHGNKAVLEELRNQNALLHLEDYAHRYPYDWRSKKPIILRATKQWFVNLEKIQQTAIASVNDVVMHPDTGWTQNIFRD